MSKPKKCRRCENQVAEQEEELCENCRFAFILGVMVEERKVTAK